MEVARCEQLLYLVPLCSSLSAASSKLGLVLLPTSLASDQVNPLK